MLKLTTHQEVISTHFKCKFDLDMFQFLHISNPYNSSLTTAATSQHWIEDS